MAVLQLTRVGTQYPGAPASVGRDINVEVGPQQLLLALDPSGSHKTTLLNVIAGFVAASTGRNTHPVAALQKRLVPRHGQAH